VVPILQRLATDCHRSNAANLEGLANGLIGKLEAIHGTSFNALLSSQLQQQPHTIAGLHTTTSMDDMKQKMGKLFQKPSGQPFWKK
jgi:hypothetical protein